MKSFLLSVIWSLCQAKRYIQYFAKKISSGNSIEQIKSLVSKDELLSGLDPVEKQNWENRILVTMSSTDNGKITRHKDAGKIIGGDLIMHNGIKVDPLSYYGLPPLKLLVDNKGVHEPQEELVFQEVLKVIPVNAVMIELGSYWSFYSMWLKSVAKDASCYMVEAELENIKLGRKNFKKNGMTGSFFQAYVGDKTFITHKGDRYINVDDFVSGNNIQYIDILHSDIQGFEFKMLQGARKVFDAKKVGYVFISTHSNTIHDECRQYLKEYGFVIIADANLDESFSADGLLVGRSSDIKGVDPVAISKRTGSM